MQLEGDGGAATGLRAQLAEAVGERDALQQSNAALESHIARLKEQLERPGRLVVKKALRRGQYKKPDAS